MPVSLAFARRPVAFLGEVLLAAVAALGGRRRYRVQDALRVLADTSARAVGIVCLVNFLVGAILAFVGAVQLLKFGAGIFVADLVAISVAREMAAIITAVVIAGRTGAAFAAELATMQTNEEVDALEVLGLPLDATRTDLRGRDYYWMSFRGEKQEHAEGTDLRAIEAGRISVTPLHIDLTHAPSIHDLKGVLGGAPPKSVVAV